MRLSFSRMAGATDSMMNELNPYNCTTPGNLFVGYEELRRKILNGFRNGNSYAILGGRRCGKTSLLIQIEKDLQAEGLPHFTPLPRFFTIQEFGRWTSDQLFERIYGLVIQDVAAEPWKSGGDGREYQGFLEHLRAAKPLLDQHYGSDWLVILLIDELDAAISKLPDDTFFQNLRTLLMTSDFHRHFRLVATGVKGMANLIFSAVSPLNNLRHAYLRVLTSEEAGQLITSGFGGGLEMEVEYRLLQQTGKHPYLLQGVLEKLWEHRTALDTQAVKDASRKFLREHHDFQYWLDTFDSAEHAVYQLLSESTQETLHFSELRQRMPPELAPKTDRALSVLSYHGVIDDSYPNEPHIAGTLFRDWYSDNCPKSPQSEQARIDSMPYVFISYLPEDSERVECLREALTDAGIDWRDRDKIAPGQRKTAEVRRDIQRCDFFIVCFSAQYRESPRTPMNEELTQAIEILREHQTDKAWLLPVKLNECEIPDRDIGGGETLRVIQPVELDADWQSGIERLLSAIQPDRRKRTVRGRKTATPLQD
jgi:hypothetical protein